MQLSLKNTFALLLLALSSIALADDGKVTHLSGKVTVQHANGQQEPALPSTEVKAGDTLHTGDNGFARLETSDGGEIVLRPGSEFHMENYHYDKDNPGGDSFVYHLLKGGLRTVTGLIGKRGNRDAYKGNTPTSTIGIRGTFFEVRVCGECGGLASGTYFFVHSGSIQANTTTVTTNQYVYVDTTGAVKVLDKDPGIGFTSPSSIPRQKEKGSGDNNSPPGDGGGDGGVNCQIQ